jgi:hypothetical protein
MVDALDVPAFARLTARLDDPFADRAAVLTSAGLDEAALRTLAARVAVALCHALHDANGNNRNGPDDNFPPQDGTSSRNEERSTVGTSGPVRQPNGTQETNPRDYSRDVPTENSFRDDLGKPRRPSYYPRNFPGGAPW